MDPILERLLAVAGTYFMLSIIVEKLADFIKLRNVDIRVRQKDEDKEKDREKRILWRNIIVGVIVALFLKADAIQILLSGEPGEVIGWENVIFFNDSSVSELTSLNYFYYKTLHGASDGFFPILFKWLQMLIGIFLTGIGLSFGSKFWHDLVGILYNAKEIRAKIVRGEIIR